MLQVLWLLLTNQNTSIENSIVALRHNLYVTLAPGSTQECFSVKKLNSDWTKDILISSPLICPACPPLLTLVVMLPATLKQALVLNAGPVYWFAPRFSVIAQASSRPPTMANERSVSLRCLCIEQSKRSKERNVWNTNILNVSYSCCSTLNTTHSHVRHEINQQLDPPSSFCKGIDIFFRRGTFLCQANFADIFKYLGRPWPN